MAGSPALPIARPETEKITPSPYIVAISVAERYVADLVGDCQAIASLFELEVPVPPPLALTPEASLPDGSGSEDEDEPQSRLASPGRWTMEVSSPQWHSQIRVSRTSQARASGFSESSPWGGPRNSESIRLKRLLDPEFRRRTSSHRQTPLPMNGVLLGRGTMHGSRNASQASLSLTPGGDRSPRVSTDVRPPRSRSKMHRPSPYLIKYEAKQEEAEDKTEEKTEAADLHESDSKKMTITDDKGYLHYTLQRLQKLHGQVDQDASSPSRAAKARMSQASEKSHRNSELIPQRRLPGRQSKGPLGMPKKFRGKARQLPGLKRAGTFEQWNAGRGEAQRHQMHTLEALEEHEEPPAVENVLKDDLKHFFRETCYKSNKHHNMVEENVDGWELHQIALELQMSVDDVLLVKSVFDTFDDNRSGTLDVEEFELAVNKLLQLQLRDQMVPTDRVKSMCEWYWWDGDKDNSGTIDFREFLRWYSSNGFNEDLLLTEQQRFLRKIAKQYKVSPDYVEHIKRCFDLIDVDKSNELNIKEFKQVLYKALKVPMHLELPPSRVQYFWAEIDTDGSGQAGFEEFFAWWVKYFDAKGDSEEMPFEAFYKQIRRIGVKYLDPPAYPVKEQHNEEYDEDMPGSTWLEKVCNA